MLIVCIPQSIFLGTWKQRNEKKERRTTNSRILGDVERTGCRQLVEGHANVAGSVQDLGSMSLYLLEKCWLVRSIAYDLLCLLELQMSSRFDDDSVVLSQLWHSVLILKFIEISTLT